MPATTGDLLLSWVFLRSGSHLMRDPKRAAEIAAPLLEPIRTVIPGATPSVVGRSNATVQLAASALLAIGCNRRLAALTLAASLIPTTIAGHAFWRVTDPSQRALQRIHFDKNLAILGGLMLAALEVKPR